MGIVLGAIADDFIGATALANFLVKEGMRTVQVNGFPDDATEIGDAQAVVVALDTRSCAPGKAISLSRAACSWFKQKETHQILFQYSSTFLESTVANIGPVADALVADLGVEIAVVCAAFPSKNRRVHGGILIDGTIENTPRRQDIVKLLTAQSIHPVGHIDLNTLRTGQMSDRLATLASDGNRYAVLDAEQNQDMHTIASEMTSHRLVTGSRGVALGLPTAYRNCGLLDAPITTHLPKIHGRTMVIGSSNTTGMAEKIDGFGAVWPNQKVDLNTIAADKSTLRQLCDWALQQPDDVPVLFDIVSTEIDTKTANSGRRLRVALGKIARTLRRHGFNRIVCSDHQSAEIMLTALKIGSVRFGSTSKPGAVLAQSLCNTPITVVLPSNCIGAKFELQDAVAMLG